MAQSKSTKTYEYDSMVIGAGLGGLITAHQLEGTGRKVALIEALDFLGGSSRPTPSKAGVLDHGLKFLPATVEAEEILKWMSGVIGQPITASVVDEPPITFNDGKFKPFVGFGDSNVTTATEVHAYAQPRYLQLSSTPKDWVQLLTSSLTNTILTQSYVTKMQVDDEFVIEVLVNGSKRYSAREVVFCATPQQLVRLLPESHTPVKLKQKLLKGEFWTSLNLDMIHLGQVTESRAVHILKGANEEPCVGLFHPPTTLEDGRTAQVSKWLTLVPRDITEDSEFVAGALKQIKRQVKRAYETSLDGLVQERIVVNPTSHGELHGLLQSDGRWPRLQNLWVISSFLEPARNLLGTLIQTRKTLAALAGEPAAPMFEESDIREANA